MNAPEVDTFSLAMGMVGESFLAAHEAMPDRENYQSLAALARFAEFEALMCFAAGKEYRFDKKLQPLVRAINDFTEGVKAEINKPLDVGVEDEQTEEILLTMQRREEANLWLDHARIAGCAMLVHFTHAYKALAPAQTNC